MTSQVAGLARGMIPQTEKTRQRGVAIFLQYLFCRLLARLSDQKCCQNFGSTFCGDGGNRTRVRKIRASNIYERSRLIYVTRDFSIGRKALQSATWTLKPSFAHLAASCAALRLCVALSYDPTKFGKGGRISFETNRYTIA